MINKKKLIPDYSVGDLLNNGRPWLIHYRHVCFCSYKCLFFLNFNWSLVISVELFFNRRNWFLIKKTTNWPLYNKKPSDTILLIYIWYWVSFESKQINRKIDIYKSNAFDLNNLKHITSLHRIEIPIYIDTELLQDTELR